MPQNFVAEMPTVRDPADEAPGERFPLQPVDEPKSAFNPDSRHIQWLSQTQQVAPPKVKNFVAEDGQMIDLQRQL
jgi:hypothetical protein